MKAAAIYARVSSEQQKEENTIASQTAALVDFARGQGYSVPGTQRARSLDRWPRPLRAHRTAPTDLG